MMFILVNLDVFDAFPSFNVCYDGLKTLEEIFDWFKNKDNPDKSNDSLDQKGIFFISYQTRTDFCLLIIGLAELDIDKIQVSCHRGLWNWNYTNNVFVCFFTCKAYKNSSLTCTHSEVTLIKPLYPKKQIAHLHGPFQNQEC